MFSLFQQESPHVNDFLLILIFALLQPSYPEMS